MAVASGCAATYAESFCVSADATVVLSTAPLPKAYGDTPHEAPLTIPMTVAWPPETHTTFSLGLELAFW
jgi:hypothetical protein